VAVAQSELSLAQSGSSPEQIRAQEARVSQAATVVETQRARMNQSWAEVQRVSAQLGNYVLRSPFAGIITKQEASVGEIVGANVKLITVISLANFEVVANVPEADIAKIQVADQAELTLDAYSDDVKFKAMVSEIDPAQTTIEGVTTYRVTLQFAEDDDRVRSGMTANVIIDTERRDQALSIPQRAVITRNGDRYVRIPDVDPSAAPVERTITVGLASSDGYIEVLSGLSEGETVIVSIRD
jgi:HlyD family secretion protein